MFLLCPEPTNCVCVFYFPHIRSARPAFRAQRPRAADGFPVGKGRVHVAGQVAALGRAGRRHTPATPVLLRVSRRPVSHTLGIYDTHLAPVLGLLGFGEQLQVSGCGAHSPAAPIQAAEERGPLGRGLRRGLRRSAGPACACAKAGRGREAETRVRLVRARTEPQEPPRRRLGSPGTPGRWERSAGVWGPGTGSAVMSEEAVVV